MALIVENGTGLADADAYISVSEADAYHTSYGNDAWADLTDPQKEIAIRRATQYIDANFRFRGVKKFVAQRLEHPRVGYADREVWPEVALSQATAELALRASAGPLLDDAESEVILREVVGPIRTDYAFKDAETRFTVVERLLSKLAYTGDGSLRVSLSG